LTKAHCLIKLCLTLSVSRYTMNASTKPTPAPAFEVTSSEGEVIRLSDFRGKKHVVLVFNRGFG